MSLRRWRGPLLLGGVTLLGLGCALLGGVPGATLGDLMLCLPLLAILMHIRRADSAGIPNGENDDQPPR